MRLLFVPFILLGLWIVAHVSSADNHQTVSVKVKEKGRNQRDSSMPVITCDSLNCNMNLVVVLDASGSIAPNDFIKAKKFIKSLYKNLYDPSQQRTRLGLVVFSDTATIIIDVVNSFSLTELENLVDTTPHFMGNTYTHFGIRKARNMILNVSNFNNNQNLIVVLTDGESSNQIATQSEANLAHSSGITIVAVGIGQQIDQTGLEIMTTDAKYVVLITSFDDLDDFVCPIYELVCHDSAPIQPTPRPPASGLAPPAAPHPLLTWKPTFVKKVVFLPLYKVLHHLLLKTLASFFSFIQVLG